MVAISVLLQPSIVRSGMLPRTSAPSSATYKPPTAKDIPPVTFTNIAHVDAAVFEPYLAQVGALWDPIQRVEPGRATESRSCKEQGQLKDDDFAEMLERGIGQDQASRKSSLSTLTPNESAPSRRVGGGLSRRELEDTPLSTIPPVYFDKNFQLENPRTFDVVSERSEVIRKPGTPFTAGEPNDFVNGSVQGPRKELATNAILQEKLSWYIDTVEVNLIPSISTASDSFFAALESLRELQFEAAKCAKQTKALRANLSGLDKKLAFGGLKVIEIKRRRRNLHKLRDATKQLSSIMQGVTHCEVLIDRGDFVLALGRLDLVDRLISGTLPLDGSNNLPWLDSFVPLSLIDLREFKALDALAEEMQQLRFRIGKGFEARFLDTLMVDLRQHIKTITPQDTLQRWDSVFRRKRGDSQRPPSGLPAYMKESNQVRQDLKICLLGLHQLRYTQQATADFRSGVMKEMKTLIRQHLPCSTDDDNESRVSVSAIAVGRTTAQQDKSAILARNLRALDPEAAEDLSVNVYTDVGEALRRLSIQVKVLLDITSGTASPPLTSPKARSHTKSLSSLSNIGEILSSRNSPILSSQVQEELTQALDMSSLLGEAVDVAQAQVMKVLRIRSEETVRLPLARFLRYFHLNRLFADECEAVSGRSGAALKDVVNNQISEFIPLLGDSARQQLASTMDADKWEAKAFGSEEEAILGRLLQGMTLDHQDWVKTSVVCEKLEEDSFKPIESSKDGNGAAKSKVRNATIDGQSYILVESAVAALRGIDQFANLIVAIPSMTTEASNTLLDFLKLFNSRSCQLILGAGARHTAGLKNINSKHLALASQALGFLIAVMPYLREFVRRHAINSPSLAEFDRVKRLYQDHQFSIHDKLIEMMSLRTTAHISAMKRIDWDADAQETSPYMQTLTEETRKLHKILSKTMPESTVASIIGPVIQTYREQWSKAFDEAVVKTLQGKARLLRDVVLFDAQLKKIDGAIEIGTHITEIVNGKQVDCLEEPAD